MSAESRLVVNQLLEDMRLRPNDFACGLFILRDSKTQISYWIGTGMFMCGIYSPYVMNFGFIQSYRFSVGLRKWKARYMLTMSKHESPNKEDR